MQVQDLLTAEAQTLGLIAAGETLASQDSTLLLAATNGLIDSWNAAVLKSLNGQYAALIAQWNAAIKRALGIAFDSLIDSWNAIVQKALAEAYDPSLYTFNALSTATPLYTFNALSTGTALFTFHAVSDLVNLTDALSLPNGWFRALQYNAAIDVAPAYGIQLAPEIVESAADAKAAILTPANSLPIYSLSIDHLLSNLALVAQNAGTAPAGNALPPMQYPMGNILPSQQTARR
jgi:hypothetical protein